MASPALLKLFRELPIFVGLTDNEIAAVAELSTQKLFPEGETIFNHGDPGIDAYVLVRGNVDIIVPKRSKPLARIGSGQIFGELAFLDGQPRAATAKAAEPSIILTLPRASFDALCTLQPRLGMVVMQNIALDLATKLRGANLALANLAL